MSDQAPPSAKKGVVIVDSGDIPEIRDLLNGSVAQMTKGDALSSAWMRAALWLIAITGAVAAGCGAGSGPRHCQADSECGAGAACHSGVCQVGLQITIASPTDGSATNGSVHVAFSVQGGQPGGVELVLSDGVAEATVATLGPPGYAYDWDTSSRPEGTYTLRARVVTGSDRYESSPVHVTVDRTPPPVPLIGSSGAANAGSVTASGTAEAGSTVSVYEGATALAQVTTSSDGAWSAALPLGVGTHSITAIASDGAGNVSDLSAPVEQVVNRAPPTVLYSGSVVGKPAAISWGPLIAVGDSDIFFAEQGDTGGSPVGDGLYRLLACPKDGCRAAPRQLASMTWSINAVQVTDNGTVAFLSAPPQTTERPAVYGCSLQGCTGGVPPVIAADGLNGFGQVLALGDRIFMNSVGYGIEWSSCAPQGASCTVATSLGSSTRGALRMAPAETATYFIKHDSTLNKDMILSCQNTDTDCTPALVSDDAGGSALVASGTTLTWTTSTRIYTCDVAATGGCQPTEIIRGVIVAPDELVIDAAGVCYWITQVLPQRIQYCLPNGCQGGAQDLTPTLDQPHSLVVDDQFVYWGEAGSVSRIARP